MPVQRRKGKKCRHLSCLAIARERIPTIFLFCVAAVFLFEPTFFSLNDTKEYKTPERVESSVRKPKIDRNAGRDGFMVLGMHRSGTSMLTGLLYMAGGYTFGGVFHKGKSNVKGFFERFDVVGQNQKWMQKQQVSWNKNVLAFDWEQALSDKESGAVPFNGGKRALGFFNDPENVPWLQKDPRMCIALKIWLKLLGDREPAIVFTYRHPLEVAMSLVKRSPGMGVTKALKLWIAYNMRAIQNSRGLCIVKTSNVALLKDPMSELQRISDELTNKCKVVAPPHRVKQEEVDQFFDPNLQHQKASDKEKEVLETHNDGACVVYGFESKEEKGTRQYNKEREAYLIAMRIYCDLESGKAHEEDYPWPDIT